MTLEENISSVIKTKMEDGTIEKMIEEKLISSIDSIIYDIFTWGDGKKAIKEKFNQLIIPVIEQHNFNDFTIKLDAILSSIVNQTCIAENKEILENFKELMIEPQEKLVKISFLFEEYKKFIAKNVDTSDLEAMQEDGDPYYEPVGVVMDVDYEGSCQIFKSSYDYATITFSCDRDKHKDLKYSIKVYKDSKSNENNWSILRAMESPTLEISSLASLSDFEILIYRLLRSYCKIKLDKNYMEDEVEPDETPEWNLE